MISKTGRMLEQMGQLRFLTCAFAGVVVPFIGISEVSEAGLAVHMRSVRGLGGI